MARPRRFDADDVLSRAVEVFTANGYRGTSVSMLSDACGLGKQSLYNSFGGKQALYLQALDCTDRRTAAIRDLLDAAADGRAAVETFFDGVVEVCTHDDPAVSACIVSAGLLEGIDDLPVADKLREKWRGVETLLAAVVARGQRDGSIRADRPRDELARLLMTLMGGLRVSARASANARQLRATIRLGLQALDPPG